MVTVELFIGLICVAAGLALARLASVNQPPYPGVGDRARGGKAGPGHGFRPGC